MLESMRCKVPDQEYQSWKLDHRFILIAAPDWGNFKKSRPHSLNASQYRDIRRKVNQQLKKKRVRFWNEVKALILTPMMNNPQLKGVHLTDESQSVYNTHIVNSIGRVMCDKCTFQPRETANHLEKALAEGCNASESM